MKKKIDVPLKLPNWLIKKITLEWREIERRKKETAN